MFEQMSEEQARDQILAMVKEYYEQYRSKKEPYKEGQRILMLPGFMTVQR